MYINERFQKIRKTEEDFDDFAKSLIKFQKKFDAIKTENFGNDIIKELSEDFRLNPCIPKDFEREYKCTEDNILSISPFLISIVSEEFGKTVNKNHKEMFPHGIHMISGDHRPGDFYMIDSWDELMRWQWEIVDGAGNYYGVSYIDEIHPEWGYYVNDSEYGYLESLIVILYILSNMQDMECFLDTCLTKIKQ